MKDNRTKVTVNRLKQIKLLFEAGAKQKHIANAFGVSLSTIQNAKKCNFDYIVYKEFVDGQFRRWKLSRTNNTVKATKDNKTSINIDAITQDTKTDFIIEKIARLESNTNWLVDRIMRIFPEDK